MKNTIFIIVFLISTVSFAQQKNEFKLNENTNLIEATYYHDNGVISQQGTFNEDGKLQGKWLSFDREGNKLASANYDNGKKVGKWFYWTDETLKEVDYSNNAIAQVKEWSRKDAIVFNN